MSSPSPAAAAVAAVAPAAAAAAAAAAASSSAQFSAENPCWIQPYLPPLPPAVAVDLNNDPTSEIQLHYLADRPEFIPAVARAQFGEWPDVYIDYFNIRSVEEVEDNVRSAYCNKTKFGCNVIATVNGEFAATACFTNEDSPVGHAYFGTKPWITCVVCEPKFRGRGVAYKLYNKVADLAQAWGFNHLWLITENDRLERMYAKSGWKSIERIQCWAPRIFTVMRRDFKPVLPVGEKTFSAAAGAGVQQ